jgi:hypothetical protein
MIALKAQPKIAQGKRAARRPGITSQQNYPALKGQQKMSASPRLNDQTFCGFDKPIPLN